MSTPKSLFIGIPVFQRIAVTFPWPGISPSALDPSGASRPRCGRIHIFSWAPGVWAACHSASALSGPCTTPSKARLFAKPAVGVIPRTHCVGVFEPILQPEPKVASTKLDSTPHSLPAGAAATGVVGAAMTGPMASNSRGQRNAPNFNRRAVRASLGHWPSIANFSSLPRTRLGRMGFTTVCSGHYCRDRTRSRVSFHLRDNLAQTLPTAAPPDF